MRPIGAHAAELLMRPPARVQTTIAGLRDRQGGHTIIEYALILASLAIIMAVSVLFFAGKVDHLFSKKETSPSVMRPPTARCDPNDSGHCVRTSVARALPDQKPGTVQYVWSIRWPAKAQERVFIKEFRALLV